MASNNIVNLSQELVGIGAVRAQDYESFGRTIAAQALRAAAKMKTLSGTSVTIPTEVTIRSSTTEDRGPAIRSGCIDVCLFDVCIHVAWE